MRRISADPIFWLLSALAAALLLFNLGGRCLWEDEAETALLGRSILHHGIPIAIDNGVVISQEVGTEFGPDGVWRWSPWMQFYLAAIGLKLFGATAFGVRFPFALLAVLVVPLTYVAALRMYESIVVARFSALALATSVWFFLHARQARYCSPAYVFACLILIAVIEIRRSTSWTIGLAISGALLFYTNYLLAIVYLVAIAIASPLLCAEVAFFKRLIAGLAGTVLLSLPGVVYFDVFGKPAMTFIPWRQFAMYATQYVTFLAPLPLLVVAAWSDRRRGATWFLFAVSLITCVILGRGPWVMFRYVTILFPVAVILIGTALTALLRDSSVIATATTLLLVFTPVLHRAPLGYLGVRGTEERERVASPIVAYLQELWSPPREADCALAAYLQHNAAPRDVVLSTYGDLLLKFYTPLHIDGGLTGTPWPPPLHPHWIIRRGFVQGYDYKKDNTVRKYIDCTIDLRDYRPVFAMPDPPVDGNPDPAFHLFHERPSATPLTVLRRIY